MYYSRRKNQSRVSKNATAPQADGQLKEDSQPYLQQKAELEAKEIRKHELEAQERRYEIGNDGERYELSAEEREGKILIRQELRGEEHSRELEVPQ